MSRKASLAKISRPRLFGVVPRERLFALLDDNRGRSLIWISGPPGAGKTTLTASYLEDRGLPAIWYQVDTGDADPATLFHYLALAAEALAEPGSISLPRFAPEHLSDLPSFGRLFFRAFFAQLPERLILVLDNYQEVPEDAFMHEILRHAIAEVTRDSSVIAISRVQAPRAFVQLAAQGAMAEVGWDRLQLTLDEVRGIAAKRSVTDDWLLKALHQQSQGWAAGITLMLERLGHFDGKAEELPTETRESVFNYFASLIFDQASEETRHILLSIAFLPRVTPTLATALSGRTEAPILLEDLYRRRMFTDRRQGAEPVYQFHTLFLEFLRARARQTIKPEELANLLHRSACALENAGEIEVAMELWLELRDWPQGIRLVLKEANSLLNSGRSQTLMRWIGQFSSATEEQKPWLLYWLGRAELQTAPRNGIKTLENALEFFRRDNDRVGQFLCLVSLLNSAIIGYVGFAAMDSWLDDLLLQTELFPDFPSLEAELRVRGALCSTLFYARPWHAATMPALHRVEELLPRCADPAVALTAATNAIAVSQLSGDFERADRIVITMERCSLSEFTNPPNVAWWLFNVGYLRFVEARYEEALDYMWKACRVAESNGLRASLREIILFRFMLEFRVVGWPTANTTLAEVEAMPKSSQPMTEALLHTYQARQAQFRGLSAEAAELAGRGYDAVLRTAARFQQMIFGLVYAELLVNAGRIDQARAVIEVSKDLIEKSLILDCYRAAIVFVEAWRALAEHKRSQALSLLREALSLAQVDNRRYYLRYLECAMPPLFRLALEEGIEVDFVQDVIRMFRLKPPKDTPDYWPWPVRIFTLGRFEAQINGKKLEFSRKLPRKTLLLLKAIMALGGRDVPEQSLCDSVWRDEDGDAARNALSITVLRLRKLLGSNECVIHQGGKVSLNPEICWVDAWAFELCLAETGFDNPKVLTLYRGVFLPEDVDESWSVATRERLRGKFIHALSMQAATLEAEGDLPAALQYYLRGIDADPIVESFHQGLMRCYEALGRRSEAFSVYRRLKHTLSVLLGVPPSEATQKLFQDMLQRQSETGAPTRPDSEIQSASKEKRGGVTRLPLRRAR